MVANHAAEPGAEQLKMYIGGMGSTGKSQVLKALMRFFDVKGESHCFTVVVPTGREQHGCGKNRGYNATGPTGMGMG